MGSRSVRGCEKSRIERPGVRERPVCGVEDEEECSVRDQMKSCSYVSCGEVRER